MDNRPKGRQKHITGAGKDVYKRGDGLNLGGPVGRQDGYAGRKTGTTGTGFTRARAGGISLGTIVLLIAAFFVLRSCMSGMSSAVQSSGSADAGYGGMNSLMEQLLGGQDLSGYTEVPQTTQSTQSSQSSQSAQNAHSQQSQQSGYDLSSLLGGFSGGSSVSSGWDRESNSGRLNTSVSSAARAKRTSIVGGGADQVTLMVYMCGTDLESKSSMATLDLQEMAAATISDQVNILVYTGGCRQWRNNIVSSSVNQIYKVESGGLRCLVQDDGSASMVKPATLTRFIQFCTENYPANRYDLILWDHGGGSLSGYGYDEKNASAGSMTLSGIDQALKAAGTKFDFIGFDACLMATLETGLMLDNYADYMIASEETEPGVGWYYTNWVTNLSKNPSISTLELGKNIVDDFVSVCNQKCPGQKTTLSVIDLAELSATAPKALTSFASSTSEILSSSDYKTVSDARAGAREFATSSRIDQIDLIHLCYNLGTSESEALAKSLLGAVKYNKTSSSITNAYGVSIYFPYQRASKVSSAVATYKAIGMDSEYTRCIQQFASMEVGGQAVSGGASDPLSSLLGSYSGGTSSQGDITSLLGALLGGRSLGNVEGLTEENRAFLDEGLDVDAAAQAISANQFDPSALVWTQDGQHTIMRLSEDQWSLVHELQLNVFYDDGEGYIDLGLDNVFDFTEDGALLGDYDGTWLAIDGQPVAYYYESSNYEGERFTITGRVPVLLNGERANLILVFDTEHPNGYIAGARFDYVNGETDTVAKGVTALSDGSAQDGADDTVVPLTAGAQADTIEFICDYYSYDGTFQNNYLLGKPMTYKDGLEISNVYINKSRARATYLFTDLFNQEYWTPVMNEQ